MKFVSAFLAIVSATMAVGSLPAGAQDGSKYANVSVNDPCPSNISRNAIETSDNSTVPKGTKTYVTTLRVNATSNNFCAATLITVAIWCHTPQKWTSLGGDNHVFSAEEAALNTGAR
ncbi:hypothetical protein PF005_g10426 [Phytophthora fragariae]|uniref:Pectate lyase n=1 Tax=Phytophthora fragariae TaxID=53985 RepID=A0A6A3FC54_9STRA|nr:hypothetical protein PF003_g6820 [Phytophthora fragariae]KAE8943139.1 hypothetical protein PF009_g7119 [Phytophthora fragariae]KAE8993798.1 hypothetical protein PF011_g16994 [Phytophthora fragariae]KAE9094259.1 hypothetical protein PF007_g17824 [Phytophthora fragariae]KAE9097643.1 hypothetical protein PF010_g15875 [Phytophthora fragariae]